MRETFSLILPFNAELQDETDEFDAALVQRLDLQHDWKYANECFQLAMQLDCWATNYKNILSISIGLNYV